MALRYGISRGESRNEPFCCHKRLSPSSVISRQIECHCGTPSAHNLNRCRSVVCDMPQNSSDRRLREHRKQSLAPESECVTEGTRRGRVRENPETAGFEALTSQSPRLKWACIASIGFSGISTQHQINIGVLYITEHTLQSEVAEPIRIGRVNACPFHSCTYP